MDALSDKVRAVFDRALEIESPTELQAYLDAACGGDGALRREVESLLRAHQSADGFLNRPAIEALADDALSSVDPNDTHSLPATPEENLPLDFLTPSQRPGSLGKLGHYEIREILGKGGSGIVFRAFDEKLHRMVAIKVLRSRLADSGQARQRFLREARSAASVRNEHVVDIHGVQEQPIPYLVMEYVVGQTLQEKINKDGALPVKETLRIAMQIGEGLAAAHRQGLVHRDIKPGNILLENGVERVKITDFGLARAAEDTSMTSSGIVAGTPLFMAPEQAQGKTIDHRADLFSLGSVLYVMCTGRPPFRAPSTLAVLKRICEETPRPIREINPEIPEWLSAIVVKLLAKEPADRFASAREVADLLARHLSALQLHNDGPPALPLQPTTAPRKAPKSRRWLWAVAALLPAAIGLAIAERGGVTNVTGALSHWLHPSGLLNATLAVAPFDADEAQRQQTAWAASRRVPVETTNSVNMKMRLIPPGEFFMTPQYRVRISQPFGMGRYEVTVGQFRAFVNETGYKTDVELSGKGGHVMDRERNPLTQPEFTWRHPDVAQGDDYPIAQISWQDAGEFCNWLSRKENKTYRLPTEAEWEWACRAGTVTAYSFGDDAAELDKYAWSEENSAWKAHLVGQKRPNAWGLYDMHGNVCEYCQDYWSEELPVGAVTDPKGPIQGKLRVIRGYSFADPADDLETTARASFVVRDSMFHFGFRVLCELPD